MPIYPYFKAEVQIPEPVWEEFGGTQEYDRKIIEATQGNTGAGSDRYSEVFEWATFSTKAEAEECERKLVEVILYFTRKIATQPAE